MLVSLLAAFLVGAQSAPLVATPPIAVPGGAGKFDFMTFDSKDHLVMAGHPGKASLAVLDTATNKAVDVPLGAECNCVAADTKGKRLFAAGPGKTLVALDSTTMTKVGTLPLDGPGDCVQFDSKRGVVYVDNDDGTNLWVVDAKTLKLQGAINIKEAPEYMEIDNSTDQIYQAIKSTATVQVIDATARKVVKEFALGTLKSPHGLALDRKTRRLFVAGKNGKLVIVDADSGNLLNTVDVLPNSDQIAYDSSLKRVYIPSEGQIQVVQIDGDGGKVIGSVPVGSDCHRVVVDRKSHDIWVAYSDSGNSYFQRFTVPQ